MDFLNHRRVSMLKSGVRIFAFSVIAFTTTSSIVFVSFGALIFAEVIGVVEEFVN